MREHWAAVKLRHIKGISFVRIRLPSSENASFVTHKDIITLFNIAGHTYMVSETKLTLISFLNARGYLFRVLNTGDTYLVYNYRNAFLVLKIQITFV
jgi:hypothetical protein